MDQISRRPRLDVGRLIMIPAAAGLLVLDLIALARDRASLLGWVSTLLTCAFYALIIWCYLRRRPAVATSRSVTAHVAAVTATLLTFWIPLLRSSGPPAGPGQMSAADLLLAVGTASALWSLRILGRNLSVLAQAREVVERGPYRWVRHPLYLAEIVSALGLTVAAGSLAALALWLALCALQAYRALREEEVLMATLPEYPSYRSRTAALLPGLF